VERVINSYKAFYRDKVIEVQAETTFGAQVLASEMFKAKKSYEVSVSLCEREDKQVTHKPLF
jgi:hypothetical protein